MRTIDRSGRVGRRSGPAVVMVLLAVACGSAACDDEGPSDDPPASSQRDLSTADLWLSFEGDDDSGVNGTPVFRDAAGSLAEARVESANGGEVERVAGPDSPGAVAFPAKCADEPGCPRAMLEVEASPALDPEERDFEFGATVWLDPDETTTGENILQKGRFGTDGGQWKLQVDNDAGNPSCVVRGASAGATPVVVRSKVSIADSAWHQVVCRRDGDKVSIEVDGESQEKDGETGSVSNDWPIRIGAPGVGDGDDQFHGRLDDVFLVIHG